MEKALLVAANVKKNQYDLDYSLDELQNLAEACDIEVIDRTYQNVDSINSRYYIGSGKVIEIKDYLSNNEEITVVIFNDELSPAQISNLEADLDIKVIDRTLLVLDIFRKRASTQEAILEVKLAQLRYLLPRLAGLNSSLNRQAGSGGFSAKGPGETQIELDRRKIVSEIVALDQKLAKVVSIRETQRIQRRKSELPIVALVGYTNAGKSSTMNNLLRLSKSKESKEVFEKDMLFATLNTSTRNIKLPNNLEFILTDTVGFVSDLPHHLVNSFRSTLEEIKEADLIIHVVDISDRHYKEEIEVTKKMLTQLECDNIPKIYLLNKADKIEDRSFYLEDSILYSNKTGLNEKLLLDTITEKLLKFSMKEYELQIPYTDGKALSIVDGHGVIKAKFLLQNMVYYKAYLTDNTKEKLKDYIK